MRQKNAQKKNVLGKIQEMPPQAHCLKVLTLSNTWN
jgi:hypothetical protein